MGHVGFDVAYSISQNKSSIFPFSIELILFIVTSSLPTF
jgi:hypothetical protein